MITMAARITRCFASFSRACLLPSATLQTRLTAQLYRGFISSSGKDGEAAIKVDVENGQINTGIHKQTTTTDKGSGPICLDMQTTTSMDLRRLNAMLPTYTGLNRNPHSDTDDYGREREKVQVSARTINNEIAVTLLIEESRMLCQKKDVFLHTDDKQSVQEFAEQSISQPVISATEQMSGSTRSSQEPVGNVVIAAELMPSPGWLLLENLVELPKRRLSILAHQDLPSPGVWSALLQCGMAPPYAGAIVGARQGNSLVRALHTTGHSKADMNKPEPKSTTDNSGLKIDEAKLKKVRKRKKPKWTTSYSNMTLADAELQLGVSLDMPTTPIEEMLKEKRGLLGCGSIFKAKSKVHEGLTGYLEVVGYPTEANPDFKEANINDIVVHTIYPILVQFKRETVNQLYLTREKVIASNDLHTSGMQEFVVMNYISVSQRKFILVVEAKKVSLGEARKQCFLAMKDMRDFNGGGTVSGFVTMGDDWRLVFYDGKFQISERIGLLFESMGQNKKRWMENYSTVVDCFNIALSYGVKDPAEVV